MSMRRFLLSLSLCVLAACAGRGGVHGEQSFYQVGPVTSLLNGVYDGQTRVAEIRTHGDQGLGTWDKLNGEGVIVDGVFYQILADGSVATPPDTAIMPFAQLTFFEREQSMSLPQGMPNTQISAYLDPQLATVNAYYALRLEGTFTTVQTRSLPQQHKPYPPFWKVQETEPKFNFKRVRGTMVGFRSPPYATNFDPTGYHLHFITESKDGGGHVLSFVAEDVTLSIDRIDNFTITLPTSEEFDRADLSKIDQPPGGNQ